jgi:hypothetical protein
MTEPSSDPLYHGVSTFLALLGMIYIIGYPLVIYTLLKTNRLNGKIYNFEFRTNYEGLYEVYKEENIRTLVFEVVILGKKILLAISLVFLGDSPLT